MHMWNVHGHNKMLHVLCYQDPSVFKRVFTTSSNKLYSFNVLVLIGKDFLTFLYTHD